MKKSRVPTHLTSLFILILCFILLNVLSVFAREEDPVRYVVTLETSSIRPVTTRLHYEDPSRVYVSSFRRGGKTLFRLRLGFYPSRKAAEEVLQGLKFLYPAAWATRVTKREKKRVISGQLKTVPFAVQTAGR